MQPELFPCASNCRLFKLTIKSSVSQLSRARPHRCTKAHTMDKLAQFFKENIISKYFWKYTLTLLMILGTCFCIEKWRGCGGLL